jgi:uncharacterized protein (TIGR02466 family)
MTKQDLEAITLFPTIVYKANEPEFIDTLRQSGLDAMAKEKTLHELYPSEMSSDMLGDDRNIEFAQYVIQTAFNIIVDQGYNMTNRQTVYHSMWMQQHHKTSGMEEHIHNDGCFLNAFYFVDVPENSSLMVLHDPRYGKVQVDIKQKDEQNLYPCSAKAMIKPQAGDIIFTNSWLPHSFTRHGSDEPLRFIHINIGLQYAPQQACELPVVV